MADINMSHSKNKISASEQVLTEPNFAEVMQRILSYAMLVIPAVGLAIQHDEVQDREDFWLDEHVQSLLHHEGVASYKAVRRLWADEINRVRDRYAVVNFNHSNMSHLLDRFEGVRGLRLRRLLLCAHRFTFIHLNAFVSVLTHATHLHQLRIDIHIEHGEGEENMSIALQHVILEYLRTVNVALVRCKCPSLDLLQCASSSRVQRLVLDNVPPYTDPSYPVITLHYLQSIQITISDFYPS